MLLLCNEASARFAKTNTVKRKDEADGSGSKPLGLEYMADRLDVDDPLTGYLAVRPASAADEAGPAAPTTLRLA